MQTFFDESDMTSFGLYLLSEEREKRVKEHPLTPGMGDIESRVRSVSDADFSNWKEKVRETCGQGQLKRSDMS